MLFWSKILLQRRRALVLRQVSERQPENNVAPHVEHTATVCFDERVELIHRNTHFPDAHDSAGVIDSLLSPDRLNLRFLIEIQKIPFFDRLPEFAPPRLP